MNGSRQLVQLCISDKANRKPVNPKNMIKIFALLVNKKVLFLT